KQRRQVFGLVQLLQVLEQRARRVVPAERRQLLLPIRKAYLQQQRLQVLFRVDQLPQPVRRAGITAVRDGRVRALHDETAGVDGVTHVDRGHPIAGNFDLFFRLQLLEQDRRSRLVRNRRKVRPQVVIEEVLLQRRNRVLRRGHE